MWFPLTHWGSTSSTLRQKTGMRLPVPLSGGIDKEEGGHLQTQMERCTDPPGRLGDPMRVPTWGSNLTFKETSHHVTPQSGHR